MDTHFLFLSHLKRRNATKKRQETKKNKNLHHPLVLNSATTDVYTMRAAPGNK